MLCRNCQLECWDLSSSQEERWWDWATYGLVGRGVTWLQDWVVGSSWSWPHYWKRHGDLRITKLVVFTCRGPMWQGLGRTCQRSWWAAWPGFPVVPHWVGGEERVMSGHLLQSLLLDRAEPQAGWQGVEGHVLCSVVTISQFSVSEREWLLRNDPEAFPLWMSALHTKEFVQSFNHFFIHSFIYCKYLVGAFYVQVLC